MRRARSALYSPRVPLLNAFVLGVVFSSAIALFAWRRGSLSGSGAFAAVAIGTSIYLGGGAAWFSALVVFFVTSTLLGKVGRARKASLKHEYEKGDTRDALQAFSNGGVAAACALGALCFPHPAWAGAFLSALATANGDTWATELGVLSRSEPISLSSLRRVPRGTSGAVSLLGIAATAGGGLVIGLVAAVQPSAFDLPRSAGLLIGVSGGVLGSMVDSVLGATLQAGYHCPRCDRATEGAQHHCGSRTQQVRGVSWLGNDLVNLLATLSGAGWGALATLALG